MRRMLRACQASTLVICGRVQVCVELGDDSLLLVTRNHFSSYKEPTGIEGHADIPETDNTMHPFTTGLAHAGHFYGCSHVSTPTGQPTQARVSLQLGTWPTFGGGPSSGEISPVRGVASDG